MVLFITIEVRSRIVIGLRLSTGAIRKGLVPPKIEVFVVLIQIISVNTLLTEILRSSEAFSTSLS